MTEQIYIPALICLVIHLLIMNIFWEVNPGKWPIQSRAIESVLFAITIILYFAL